ncbi:MAG TPA: hypothetical protein VF961_10995 [Pyrinomonadaceae bacterium]
MRGIFYSMALLLLLSSAAIAQSHAKTRRASVAAICGNPKVACKTSVTFHPNDLPFQVPKNAVIVDTELFYAIILKSVNIPGDSCDVFIPENERLAAQVLFPDRKVFSSRCIDPENLFYLDETVKTRVKNMSETHRIMALYAGTTLADAKRVLQTVKATGKFPGANIRRLRTGFNGT